MVRKRNRGLISTLGVALVAALASSALAAGAAQAASWHVNGEPYSGTGTVLTAWAWAPNTLEADVPKLGATLQCSTKEGEGTISESTKIQGQMTLEDCQLSEIGTGKPLPCVYVKPVTLTYDGTGDSISTNQTAYLEWKAGTGCQLPLKSKFGFTGLSLSYEILDPEFSVKGVTGSGTGNYGIYAASVLTDNAWWLLFGKNPVSDWGWY